MTSLLLDTHVHTPPAGSVSPKDPDGHSGHGNTSERDVQPLWEPSLHGAVGRGHDPGLERLPRPGPRRPWRTRHLQDRDLRRGHSEPGHTRQSEAASGCGLSTVETARGCETARGRGTPSTATLLPGTQIPQPVLPALSGFVAEHKPSCQQLQVHRRVHWGMRPRDQVGTSRPCSGGLCTCVRSRRVRASLGHCQWARGPERSLHCGWDSGGHQGPCRRTFPHPVPSLARGACVHSALSAWLPL